MVIAFSRPMFAVHYLTDLLRELSFGLNSIFWLISGLILSVFVSVGTILLKEHITRPILEIEKEFVIKEGNFEVRAAVIKNNGGSVARNCVATLITRGLIQESILAAPLENTTEPIKSHPEDEDLSGNLCWAAPTSCRVRNLNRGESAVLWLYREQKSSIVVPSELGWETPTYILSSKGSPYTADLKITAENTNPMEKETQIGFEE